MTGGSVRRAHMVRKALRYFEDKSNRSVSEDNLFTRRKNLAVHLGLDEKVSKREVQKITTFCLPVPSSEPAPPALLLSSVHSNSEEELLRTKNLVSFLGMKDGLTASIASQGTLSDDNERSADNHGCAKVAAIITCYNNNEDNDKKRSSLGDLSDNRLLKSTINEEKDDDAETRPDF